jgi:DNA-binding NtrC family response regulator
MSVIRIIAQDATLHQLVRVLLPDYTIGSLQPDLLIAELSGARDCRGAEAVRRLRETQPHLPVVVISGGNAAAVTQQAVRLRVDDFFTLPAESAEFRESVDALLTGMEAPAKYPEQQNGLLGDSPNMAMLRKYVARVALTDSNVLIMGETGTGKELVAELIHKGGARRNKPFVAVNAAAVPDALLESELFGYEKGAFTGAYSRHQGKLRQAHGGTIFFDEIGDIGLGAQAKLLRTIESREVHPLGSRHGVSVDVRLIAATNRDLEAMVRSREFRQDLFYRLDVVRIEMPPLRDNREDIPQLLAHFVETFNRRFQRKVRGFQPDAAELLAEYDWPGNIRQLRNLVESCFVNTTADLIGIKDFPAHFRMELESKLDPQSLSCLLHALRASNWNITRAAWQLQCSRMTVYRKMALFRVSRHGSKAMADDKAGRSPR